VLELVKPGGGQVFHHPADDALRTYAHPDFVQAMQEAWEAARTSARKDTENESRETDTGAVFDGHWRLIQGDQPVREVRGNSASGAAVLGWYHLFRGTIPDIGMIVLAAIAPNLRLEKVGGVPAKVEAIAADDRFDTIVVASKKNVEEAKDAMLGGRQSKVDVKDPDENEPWQRMYVTLSDGRVMKVVNLDSSRV
jgi:hypothetical protein